MHHPNWPEADLIPLMVNTDIASYDYHNYIDGSPPHRTQQGLLSFSTMRADQGLTNGWGGNVRVAQACGVDHPTNPTQLNKRFQTYEEYRWDAFAHLASVGARGFLNWIYEDAPSWYLDPNTDVQIGRQHGGAVRRDFQFDVLQDVLGASSRSHASGHLEGVQEFFTLTCNFRGPLVPWCATVCPAFSTGRWKPLTFKELFNQH